MKYLGYTLTLDAGRYKVYAPDGNYIGRFNDATEARKWVREHRAAKPTTERESEDA